MPNERCNKRKLITLAALLFLTGCSRQGQGDTDMAEQPKGVTVVYHGHACFTIRDSEGFRVVIDPFDESVGYPMPKWQADVCLASHAHFDHANCKAVECPREPFIAREGEFQAGKLTVLGVKAPHWSSEAVKARGDIVIYRWDQDGISLCHLGDLGQVLTDEQAEKLKPVDVLFVPVGGNYTIGPKEAVQVIRKLQPAIAIPMHYKTSYSAHFDVGTLGDFTDALPTDWQVRREAGNFIFVDRQVLDQLDRRPTIWVINP